MTYTSPASASSSTLFTTPIPLATKDLEHEVQPPRPSAGIGLTPNRMSANGFIEPHHSHLPRRRRMTPGRGPSIAGALAYYPSTPPANQPRSPSPIPIPQAPLPQEGLRHPTSTLTPSPPTTATNPTTNNTTEPPTSSSPLLAPEIPLPASNLPHSQSSNLLSLSHSASIGPSRTNLPRRKRPSTQRYAKQDKEDSRCIQPLKGCDGGETIDVGFLDEDAEAEVVLLRGDDELKLSLLQPEAAVGGTCSLDDLQLREACAFIHRCCLTRTRILTPRARPEEAISIAALYLSSFVSLTPTSSTSRLNDLVAPQHPSAPIDIDTDLPTPDVYSYTSLHLLVMGWHDEGGWADRKGPYIRGGDVDSDNDDHKEQGGGAEGLRDEWRGVLSFEGMQRLAALVESVSDL